MQLVPPHAWGNPAGRVWTRPPTLYSPWRELSVESRSSLGVHAVAAGALLACFPAEWVSVVGW